MKTGNSFGDSDDTCIIQLYVATAASFERDSLGRDLPEVAVLSRSIQSILLDVVLSSLSG